MQKPVFVLVGLIGLSGTAFAEDVQPPAQQTNAPTKNPTSSPDPVICRVLEPETGTRLGAHKVCQKQSIWDQQKRDSGDDLERLQKGATLKNPQG